MVDFSPPLVAAIISGVISFIGAILSGLLNHYINQSHRRDVEKQRWLQEVASLTRDIQTRSIEIGGTSELELSEGRIDYENSSNDIKMLGRKVSELKNSISSAPPKADLSEIKDEIKSLIDRCENPTGGAEPIENGIDLSDYTYEKSKTINQMANKDD
ncbi:MAG: hypothetical protein ABEI86_14725 [Halobacteriaceae archaeon]